MFSYKKKMEENEKKTLAPYAVKSAFSRGREFSEEDDQTRTCFQRDRDRIIYSKSFRRLSGKTQVFVATYGDHFRDRLSHTLETAQLSRGIARSLGLNEDLAETIALAHDLGHTPFGHAGEYTMDKIMRRFGSRFEHNEQSKRIVEKLEKQFPQFDGLNLTHEVREGLSKHQTHYDQNGAVIVGKTLEAQVADVADEIAYHNHDTDDGLRSKLFGIKDLERLKIWKQAAKIVKEKHGEIKDYEILRRRIISCIVSLMVDDVVKNTLANIKRYKVRSIEDVLNKRKNLICFSAKFSGHVRQLRKFLWRKMYQSKKVLSHSKRGQKVLENLFRRLYKNPKLMPKRFWERIGGGKDFEPKEVVVKDFVAGCTDEYAEKIPKNKRQITNKNQFPKFQ